MSAFAGLIVLVAGWPLNSFVTKRGVTIQKNVLAARDIRMRVLTELFGSVRASGHDTLRRAADSMSWIGEIHQILRMGG